MKRILIALALLFTLAIPALAQDTPMPVTGTVPAWFQLAMDNIEWLFGIIAFFFIYRSVPPNAFKEGLERARKGAKESTIPDDDRLVEVLAGIYDLISALKGQQVTATVTDSNGETSTTVVSSPVKLDDTRPLPPLPDTPTLT